MQCFKTKVCKSGNSIVNKRYIKGVPFLPKWYIKGKGLDLGAEPLRIKLC